MEERNTALLQSKSYPDNALTEENIKKIDKKLTKTGIQIIQLLASAVGLQQKAIAASLGLSATNTSNHLKKLSNIAPSLLCKEKKGRTIHYSLTPIGAAYANYLSKIEAERKGYPLISEKTALQGEKNEALEYLNNFIKKSDKDWYVRLDNILQGYQSSSFQNRVNLGNDYFEPFICALKKYKIFEKDNFITDVYEKLQNNILQNRLEQILEETQNHYNMIQSLVRLYNKDMHAATELVDYAFEQIMPEKVTNVLNSKGMDRPKRISVQTQNTVTQLLQKCYEEICFNSGDKYKVSEFWETEYHTSSMIMLYVAEKCRVLYLLAK